MAVAGDWNGSGSKKIGIFNPSQALWLLDINGNGVWDGAVIDRAVLWGSPNDKPVVGKWNGGVADKIGTFNSANASFLLDYNGNFIWDGTPTDKNVSWGSPGDKPVVGDWNEDGIANIGTFNPSSAEEKRK